MALTLNTSQLDAFDSVATRLRMSDAQWLVDLVRFESGFNPSAKNPLSSARGLIQFIDSTARGLGYADSRALVTQHPDMISQLEGPVYEYLRPYSPYTEEFQLYMAVFLPIARRYSADTLFQQIYKDHYGDGWQTRYNKFKRDNPGILTPQDYVDLVKKKPIIRVATRLGIGGLAVLGMIWYLAMRR